MLFTLAHTVFAASASDQEFVKLVENINSFESRFTQIISDNQEHIISKTQGQMKVLRPGKFYWKSNSPDSVLIVADGNVLWTYDVELEQVTKQDLAQVLSASPAAILIGSTHQLLSDFKVLETKKDSCQTLGRQCFSLTPLNESEMFQNVTIIFEDKKLVEVTMQDPLGQNVQTIFTQVKINTDIDKSIFTFSPPNGVDVIRPN